MKKLLLAVTLGSLPALILAQDLIAAKEKGKKYGYINIKGDYRIEPQFDMAYAFAEGYAVVKSGEKYGVINAEGKYVISPQFDFSREQVSEGKLSVWKKDAEGGAAWASINMKGEEVIPYSAGLAYLSSFHEGYVIAGNLGQDRLENMSLYNSVGRLHSQIGISLPAYEIGRKGQVRMETDHYEPIIHSGRLPGIPMEGDSELQMAVAPKGFLLLMELTEQSIYRGDLCAGASRNGIIPYYKPSSGDPVRIDSLDRYEEPIAFSVKGQKGYPFFNGIAAIEQDGKWVFINTSGSTVGETTLSVKEYRATPPMYFGGLIGFFKQKKVGYVNLKGEVIIPFQFSEYHPFEYELTPVKLGGKFGLLRKDGTWAVQPRFEDLSVGPCPCYR